MTYGQHKRRDPAVRSCRVFARRKPSNLRDDTPLRTSGILDSAATLRLVSFVEDHYGIEVQAHEAWVENFDRIDSIASFVTAKGGAAR